MHLRLRPGLCLFPLVCLLLAGTAQAALLEVDLAGGPANEVSYDDATGLYWLDLTMTTGLTFYEVEAVAEGLTSLDWRPATTAEICGLLASHAIDPQCSGTGQSYATGPLGSTLFLRSMLGFTHADERSTGYFDNEGIHGFGMALLSDAFTYDSVSVEHGAYGYAYSYIGTFLVTDNVTPASPVPEPSTGLLLLLGLGGLARGGRTRSHGPA